LFVSQTVVYIRLRRIDGENVNLLLCLPDTVVSKWKLFSVIFWKTISFTKVLKLRPFIPLERTIRWQGLWSIFGMILTGKIRSASTKLFSMSHSFILLSVLRQAHSHFQSQFFTECDLVLHLSILSNRSFLEGHPVSTYVALIYLLSLLSCPLFIHKKISHGQASV